MKKNTIKDEDIDIITHYLKQKKNYIYFSQTNSISLSNQFNTLLLNSKQSYLDINASSFYLIKKTNTQYDEIKLFKPETKSSFEKFNSPSFDLLFCEASIFNFVKYFSQNSCEENKLLLRNLLISLDLVITENLTCIVDLKKIFEKFGLSNTLELDSFIDDIIQNYESSTEEFLDIQRNILEEYNRKNSQINEIGIFYKTSFYPDFFKRNAQLVEINLFKNWLSKNDLIENIQNYYNMSSSSESNDYFSNFSHSYEDSVAYFDPFILLKKEFYNDFISLQNKFPKQNKNDFTCHFFNTLNQIQFFVIDLQQRQLINDIFIYESKDKEHFKKACIKFFWETSIKNLELYNDITDPKIAKRILALKSLLSHNNSLTKYSNITINDFPFENYSNEDKLEIEKVLNATLFALNKDQKNQSLLSIRDAFSEVVEQELININVKLSMDNKYFINPNC
ncbi:MAG: hypothetical protein RBR93_12530 [Aliarcobacter butzleri]|nr:hypothetical protein [Aliarcobacter butzleri]